jgi:hypothetical protein
MRTTVLGSAVAIAVAAVAFSGPANAACYWNSYNWNCRSPQIYVQPYGSGYGYEPSYQYSPPGYGYEGSYAYPGPRASSGGGRF